MNKEGKIAIIAIAVILGTAISLSSVFADSPQQFNYGPNHNTERHEAMEKAFENKDYNAWKNLMNRRGRINEIINKNNFDKFAKMHELMENGQIKEAQKIREELGLPANPKRFRRNVHNKRQAKIHNRRFKDANHNGICDYRE